MIMRFLLIAALIVVLLTGGCETTGPARRPIWCSLIF